MGTPEGIARLKGKFHAALSDVRGKLYDLPESLKELGELLNKQAVKKANG
jgi:hypothetical protein